MYAKKSTDDPNKVTLANRAGSLGKWIVRNMLWKSGMAYECIYGNASKSNE